MTYTAPSTPGTGTDTPTTPSGDAASDVLTNNSVALFDTDGAFTTLDYTGASKAQYSVVAQGAQASIMLNVNTTARPGIVTTTSAGAATSVVVEFNAATKAGSRVFVYGSTDAYTSTADLYQANLKPVDTLTYTADAPVVVADLGKGYAYVGLRAEFADVFLSAVTVNWNGATTNIPSGSTDQPGTEEPGDKPGDDTPGEGKPTSTTLNVNDATNIKGTFNEETKKEDGSVQAAANYQPLESFTLGGYTFTFTTEKGTAPAYYYATSTNTNQQKTVRVYNNSTFTVTAPKDVMMTKAEFTGSNATPNFQVDNGTWTASGNNAVWTNEKGANSFTVTVSASWRFSEVVITFLGSGSGDQPGGEEPGDKPGDDTPGEGTTTATFEASSLGDNTIQPLESFKVGDVTFTLAKGSGTSQPQYFVNTAGKDVRTYANNTITVTAPEGVNVTEIVFTLSAQGLQQTATVTASAGTVAKQASSDTKVTWTGSANTFVFTVGATNDFGTNPDKNAGQFDFSTVSVTYTGGSGSTDQPGGEEPGDKPGDEPGDDKPTSTTLNVNDATNIKGTFVEETKKEDGSVQAAAHYQPLESFTLGGYTFTFTTETGTAPAYYYATSTNTNQQKTVRVYNGSTFTVTAPKDVMMTKAEFTGSNGTPNFSAVPDKWTASGNNAVWTNEKGANSFTVTVSASWRFSEVVITFLGSGSGDQPGGDEPGDKPGTDNVIFSETFANGEGDFTINDGTLPEGLTYVWNADTKYGYMKASAYISSTSTSYATDAWLISPEIELDNYDEAYLSFDHAINKFASLEDAKKAVSVNVRIGTTGAWTALTIPTWGTNNDWTFVNSGLIDLSDFCGQTVQIGFHYTSTTTNCGTWEVKNVLVTSSDETPEKPGESTQEPTDFITVAEAIALKPTSTTEAVATGVWVRGYIVGYFDSYTAFFNKNATTTYNILIADNDDVTNAAECVCVQLPFGDVRSGLNLQDNPELFGMPIAVYGDVMLYNSMPGVKNTTDFYIYDPASVSDVAVDEAPVEFFNLQGVRVNEPAPGAVYIRRQGNNVSKVLVK